ncbi:MAG: radical SAM protein, partial [Candidatus Aenigmarchaeota archaeon]|nr:radical SAM protein [Candidatus Aenigmarchaeota archaeon]
MKIVKIKARRAFTPTKIPGADYVINQYVGCQHACRYCYAKFMCKWYSYGKWGSWIVVKENLPELVKSESVKREVYMSSVSDPYQPIEKKIKLTRRILENMDKDIKLGILTKSDLVLRDVDVFKEFKDIKVGLTINDFDGKLKKEIEPFSPNNGKRIEALRFLHEN